MEGIAAGDKIFQDSPNNSNILVYGIQIFQKNEIKCMVPYYFDNLELWELKWGPVFA